MPNHGAAPARPARSVAVRTEEEARTIVGELYAAGVPINVLGAGHLLENREPVAGGVVLANQLRTRLEIGPTGEIRASSGWTWLEVVEFAARHGVTLPVLTSNLSTTVGGTLSAGGFGLLSHRSGMQTDHVSSCSILTAKGTFDCPRSGDPLWRSSLCSLGTTGFLLSVTLETTPMIDQVRLFERRDPPADAVDVVLDMADRAAGRACLLTCRFENGLATTHVGFIGSVAGPGEPHGERWQERSVPYALLLRQSTRAAQRPVRRVWNDFIVPVANAGAALRAALDLLEEVRGDPAVLRARVRLLSIAESRSRSDDGYLKPQVLNRSPTIGIGFYVDVAPDDRDRIVLAVAHQARLKSECRRLGGALYSSGEDRFSETDCREIFGENWDDFSRARRDLDPAGLFGNNNTFPFKFPPR